MNINEGSFENETLENEDRSTKHPNLENEAPKTRKWSTQNSKTKTPRSKTKHPNLETSVGLISAMQLYVLYDAIRIRWRQRMRPHL